MRRISTMFLIFVLSTMGLAQANQNAVATPQSTQPSSTIEKVTTGMRHTCALTSKGGVACWGDGPSGALGLSSLSKTASPVFLDSISNAVDVSAGTWHTCAVLKSGMVMCWGDNTSGQLGNGSTSNSWIPVEVQGLTNAVSVSAGTYHTCAVTSAGKVFCWGSDTRGYGTSNTGQLGNGLPFQDSSYPSEVQGLAGPAIQISSGESHTCAVIESKQLQCWGKSRWGELGNGNFSNSPSPVLVSNFSFKEATQVSASFENTCSLLGGANSGDAYCWGFQTWGVLGEEAPAIGSYVGSAVPVKGSISGVTYIDTGGATACAIKNREVWCWGSNQQGQIQSSSLTADGWFQARTSTPTKVNLPGPVDKVSISEGVEFESTSAGAVCAWSLTDVYCWGGYDATGQQGNGAFSQGPTSPQKVNEILPSGGGNGDGGGDNGGDNNGGVAPTSILITYDGSDTLGALQLEFATGEKPQGPFGGATTAITEAPAGGLGGSSLAFTKNGESWAGLNALVGAADAVKYTDASNSKVTFNYYSPKASSPVALQLFNGDIMAVELIQNAARGWNNISFDLATAPNWSSLVKYNKIVLFPDFLVPAAGEVYYFDNIAVNGAVTPQISIGPAPLITGLKASVPFISGIGAINNSLTAIHGDWDSGATLTYQWFRDGAAVPAATSSSYTVQASDYLKKISVAVTGSKEGYISETKTSESVIPVKAIDRITSLRFTGSFKVGAKAFVSPVNRNSKFDYSYQWLRNGEEIAGASSRTYQLAAEDVGSTLSAKVCALYLKDVIQCVSQDIGSPVELGVLKNVRASFSGLGKVGRLLSAAPAIFDNQASVSYQWLRNGEPIADATRNSYFAYQSDKGSSISLRVSVSKPGYVTVVRTSTAKFIH